MSKNQGFLFDTDSYKKGKLFYQVRLVEVENLNDQGQILATFANQDHCGLMNNLKYDRKKYSLCVVEYIQGEGMKDAYGLDQLLEHMRID